MISRVEKAVDNHEFDKLSTINLQHREQILHYEPVDTGLVKFLKGRIFHLCNSFTRHRENSVIKAVTKISSCQGNTTK